MHDFAKMTEPELKKLFNEIATIIKYRLPKDTGFILLASPFGGENVAQFVSNVQREDSIKWMRETILRLDRDDYVQR